MSHCALVISLYMYITYMLFSLVHMVVADQQLFFQIKRVEGQLQGQLPTCPQQSWRETASRQTQPLFYLSFWILSQKFPLAWASVLDVPSLIVIWKAFLWTKFQARGGGYHKVVAFIGYFFYIYILYICIYSNIFSIHNQVCLFYFGDTGGMFCSLPVCL